MPPRYSAHFLTSLHVLGVQIHRAESWVAYKIVLVEQILLPWRVYQAQHTLTLLRHTSTEYMQ